MKDLGTFSAAPRESKPLGLKPGARPKSPEAPIAASSAAPAVAAAAVRHVTISIAHAGQRVDNFLIRELKGVPKTHVYRIVRSGEVRVNGGRVKAETKLQAGDELRIPPVRVAEAPVHAQLTGEFPHEIVWEDDHLLAVNKPSGVAVHGGSGVSFGVIEQIRMARPGAPMLELVHRLDRETSGVLFIAKTRAGLIGMHETLRDKSGDKRYLAVVKGEWVNDRQHVKAPLAKFTQKDGERRVEVNEDEGQFAHTIFNLLERRNDMSLLEAELKTGRTHQIRVHLQHVGFPIAGDTKYGNVAWNKSLAQQGLKRMFLHAKSFAFEHPVTGVAMKVEAPLPGELARFWYGG
ncbi:MAG: RluA family pseudouridine synthase [Betaproteobacteria bacterium]|nr:MAG: RluA family pseudouridine synthase [Betaproteobacteria bacterium]